MRFPAIARRSVGVVALGAAALAVAGVGIATATTDQNGVVLGGVANHTQKPTGFINKKGPALALTSNKHKPPLTVNSSKLVKHLNAAKVGGKSAGQLATAGSAARTEFPSGTFGQLTTTPQLVASTAMLAPGTYYVSASTTTTLAAGNTALCDVATTAPKLSNTPLHAGASATGVDTVPMAVPVELTAPKKIGWYCWILGTGPATELYYYAGITAIRVEHSAKGSAAAGAS